MKKQIQRSQFEMSQQKIKQQKIKSTFTIHFRTTLMILWNFIVTIPICNDYMASNNLSFLTLNGGLLQLKNNTSHATVVFKRFAAFYRLTEVTKFRNSFPFSSRFDIIGLSDVFLLSVSEK